MKTQPFGIHSCYKNIITLPLIRPIKEAADQKSAWVTRSESFGDLIYDRQSHQLLARNTSQAFSPYLTAPEFVSIALTARCNLRCKHCYPTVYNSTLPLEVIIRLFDELEAMKVFSVSLSGGEPLLHPHIDQIIELGYRKQFHLSLFTNGLLVTAQRAKQLKSLGIGEANVSIDSADPHLHDEFRGASGAFEKSILAVDNLVNAGINTWITCTVSSSVEVDPLALTRLAIERGASKIRFVEVVNSGEAIRNRLIYDSNWVSKIDAVLKMVNEHLGQEIMPSSYFDFRQERGIFRTDARYAPYGCGAGTMRARITARGHVLACPFLSEDIHGLDEETKTISPDTILAMSFQEIWHNSPYLEAFRQGVQTIQGKCGHCEHHHQWCAGGCRAEAIFQDKRADTSDPTCNYHPIGYQKDPLEDKGRIVIPLSLIR